MRLPRLPAALPALAALVAIVGAANAEVVQKGNLRVAVSGRLSPRRLPRTGAAPIAVRVGGQIDTLDGGLPAQLRSLRIELNRHGRLETRGLPECRIGQIQPASTARALSNCRSALIGTGSFSAEVVLGSQTPYPTSGRLLVFNGNYNGRPAFLGQIYSAHPFANSFVIPFLISRRKRGAYGIVLTARLPPAFTAWGYMTGLEMRLSRRYSDGRSRHSLISASCPAAKGFSGAVFDLARTTFAFTDGTKIVSTLSSECRVRRAAKSR